MDIFLKTSEKHQSNVINQINKRKTTYANIEKINRHTDKKGNYYILICHKKLLVSHTEKIKIKKSYEKLEHVSDVSIIQTNPDNFMKNYKNRDCRFIFDIDSTLTPGEPGILSRESRSVLEELRSSGHWIHFATGRSDGDLYDLISECNTEPQGIAENGGLLVLSKTNIQEMGSRKEPDMAYQYLKKKFKRRLIQDIKQGSRITERIIKKNLTRSEVDLCTKKYSVKVLSSKNSYHIVDKHVNKGIALRKLSNMRHWDKDLIISVGDSDLDVPMFQESNFSFAVSNASKLAKKHASVVLDNSYVEGVQEMFRTWFMFSKLQ